jgi:hypothetical protein
MRFAILCSAILLSSCAGQRIETTKSMEDTAKIVILKTARDPSSIEFGGRFASGHRLNYTLACGWVNGANGFNGKTGWTLVGVMFPDNGLEPFVLPSSLPADLQCPLAGAKPDDPGVSNELMRKHGIGAPEPEQKISAGKAPQI